MIGQTRVATLLSLRQCRLAQSVECGRNDIAAQGQVRKPQVERGAPLVCDPGYASLRRPKQNEQFLSADNYWSQCGGRRTQYFVTRKGQRRLGKKPMHSSKSLAEG